MASKQLQDDDYTLRDGCAWFAVGGFSIRINKTSEGIDCSIFQDGREDQNAIATCYALDSDLEKAD